VLRGILYVRHAQLSLVFSICSDISLDPLPKP
jgi:hypothetical protein